MKWLARLKIIEIAHVSDPAETTKSVSVVSAGSIPARIQTTEGHSAAANDPAPDADRWAWPQSSAMTAREIVIFTVRLHHFSLRGLAEPAAELLADKLVQRDRESDDRRLCLECAHLAGKAAGSFSCRNWQRAQVTSHTRGAQLSGELVQLLQRCNGFKGMES